MSLRAIALTTVTALALALGWPAAALAAPPVDTVPPTASIVVADSTIVFRQRVPVTFTFSEAVTGFTNADITVPNGTLTPVSSADGGITWTATYAPTPSIEAATNVITLDLTGVTDAAANVGIGAATSNTFAIDTKFATVAIVVADTAINADETSLVTFTFSEPVTGFTNGNNVRVSNGTLTAVSSADGGTVWTATFTPAAATIAATNRISVSYSGIKDLAGNPNLGSASSNAFAINTVRPTATVAVSDTDLIAGETSLVTVTFSQAVTGLDAGDLTAANGTLNAPSSADGGITWTATLTPTEGTATTTNQVTLDLTGIANAAGSTGTGTATSNTYEIDTERPTATIVVADQSQNIGETSLVTITFSEAVAGFTNTDLTVQNGTLTALSSADGGITWTATLTPSSATTSATNVITADLAGVSNATGNAGAGTATSNTYAVDTQRPTATIVLDNTTLLAGQTTVATITFSEPVTGLTNADLTIANGTLSAVTSADGGRTWTATFTPTANLTDGTNLITLDQTGVADLAGNSGTGTVDSANYAVGTVRPTAGLVVADTYIKAGETSLVTVTFSEAVTGFDNTDLSIANGTLSAVTSTDGGSTWTATLTPTSGITVNNNLITLDLAGVTGGSGNAGDGTVDSNNYRVGTERPTAIVEVADDSLTIGESTTLTITFSTAVTGLTTADITHPNVGLVGVRSIDGGITWSGTLRARNNITDATNVVTVDLTGVTEGAGNAGIGTADSSNYAIDTVRPTATVVLDNTNLGAGQTSPVTITFSEAVTGFDNAGLTAPNGTVSDVTSADGGVTYTATFTPTDAVTDFTNIITVDLTGVADVPGNAGTGTVDSANYAVDTVRPTATVVVANDLLSFGGASLVTITFSEAVTGFTLADLTVGSGTVSSPISSDGGVTFIGSLTPTNGVTAATNLVTLDLAGVTDATGNAGSGTVDSNNYAVDTERPTATIVLDDAALAAGGTSSVTITFSEAVSGLSDEDVTVANGTLSVLSSADGNLTYTATFTPTPGITAPANTIIFDLTGIRDVAGNTGFPWAYSNNYAIDTERPTATVVITDVDLAAGESSPVSVTFSEAVTGLDTADLTAANGALTDVTSTDGGATWTTTFTPTDAVTAATNVITLGLAGVTDLAGNAGTGTVDSANYTVDTQRPTGTVVVADDTLTAGETSLVTFTFSEPVTGLTVADVTVANGSIANGTADGVSSADGGTTWTGTFTPTSDITEPANLITLDLAGVTDAAGNPGVGTTDSNSYAIDTVAPTTPDPEPSPTPTPTPTPEPSATPTPAPEPSATPAPTASPAPTTPAAPEPTATPAPSVGPTPAPTATPTPTGTPAPTPPVEPTPEPTATPQPTPGPTAEPTPTEPPTQNPQPTDTPTAPGEADITAAIEGGITLSDGTVTAGDQLTISGLAPNQWYFTWFFSTPMPTSWQLASAEGTIDLEVPTTLAVGEHRVIVQDAAGAVFGWSALTVQVEQQATPVPSVPQQVDATPPVQSSSSLAQTGFDAGLLLAAAGALVLVGLILAGVALLRRRRRPEAP